MDIETEVKEEEIKQEVKDEPKTLTLTEQELEAKMQSEADKRVTKALETAKAKWASEFEQKLEVEKAEAEKLARMSTEERAKAKEDKEKEEMMNELKKYRQKEMVWETERQMKEQELPTEFASLLVSETAEETSLNIKNFSTNWQKAIEAEVNKRLANGVTPKASTSTASTTKEDFNKMNYKERLDLFNKNPEVYKQLNQ